MFVLPDVGRPKHKRFTCRQCLEMCPYLQGPHSKVKRKCTARPDLTQRYDSLHFGDYIKDIPMLIYQRQWLRWEAI